MAQESTSYAIAGEQNSNHNLVEGEQNLSIIYFMAQESTSCTLLQEVVVVVVCVCV